MPENKQSKTLLPDTETPTRRHRPFYKHPFFYLFLIIALAAGIIFAVKHFSRPASTPEATSQTTTSAEPTQIAKSPASTTDVAPTTSSETSATPTVSPDGKTPEKYDGSDPNTSESLTGALSAARFDGDKLVLRVTIDQYLSGGTCNLTLSDGANQLNKSAALTPVVSTSSCEGFDVSGAELSDFSRPLNITINLTSGDKTGTITGVVE